MTRSAWHRRPVAVLDYDSTLVLVVEVSAKSWLIGAQVPGLARGHKHKVEPAAPAVWDHIEALRRRAERAGHAIRRVALAYEAGRDGFWLARWLIARGVEVDVIQPASIAVDRRARRAKTDAIDVELLLRSFLAWLRGEPRVCSMVPVPSLEEEDGRRPVRERQALIAERIALVNRIESLLATLGITDYQAMKADRRQRLDALRTAEGGALPANAHAEIGRALDRLECILAQIKTLEAARDAVVAKPAPANATEAMIRSLAALGGIGPELASVLVWEAFVRPFPNRKALAGYAGLAPTPFASGGSAREQGIAKAGNRRLRASLVELAWLWVRYQPQSALAKWFHERTAGAGARGRKIMIVALARKLFIALWRFLKEGVVPDGAALKRAHRAAKTA